MSLTHPPVNMPESRRYEIVELLRVHENHLVAWLRHTEPDGTVYNCIGTRWVSPDTHKVFPQSRGYATWKEEPSGGGEEMSYLGYLLPLPGVDVEAVGRVSLQLC